MEEGKGMHGGEECGNTCGHSCGEMHKFCPRKCCFIKCLLVVMMLIGVFAAGVAVGHERHDGYGRDIGLCGNQMMMHY